MRIIVLSLVFFTVLCSGTPNTDVDDLVIDEVIRAGDIPDLLSEETELNREKILKENGLDKVDPSVMEEFRALVFEMYGNSKELQDIVKEVKKQKKLDFSHRRQINSAFWREYSKNKKIYKPKFKAIGKKLPAATLRLVKRKLFKSWKSMKNFFKHPINSMSKKKDSHNIEKRFLGITTAALIGIASGLVALGVLAFIMWVVAPWLLDT